ncbi:MAG TPA: DUF3857 domain-containing protein [Rariglobus sp.]|jgi:transglutaminase-like putative cysteine protease|nr:DUF3857 domain-containing protein [Rariglobus sp.]
MVLTKFHVLGVRLALGWLLGLIGFTNAFAAVVTEAIDPASLVVSTLPTWITPPLEVDPAAPSMVAGAGSSPTPTRLCVIENQMDVAGSEDFRHYAYRIETEAGLQQAGQISIDFVPSYQQLHWHFLRIWRDGHARDVLIPTSIQVLRQEQDAEKFLYRGYMTALVILHDLRVGDIVEFAYTRIGQNPVFAGRFSTTLTGASTTPVDHLYYRIRGASGRALQIAPSGDFKPVHHVEVVDGREDHTWTGEGIKAISPVNDAPAHEGQFPYLQVTEYTSWNEVREWAHALFGEDIKPSPEVMARVATIIADCKTQDAKANALLRFVQDDIRYLGIQLLESTHRPTPPLTVLDRRFGDCKDKALLFVVLLRGIGMDADVALVNSTWQRGLAKLQPSPLSFDHAIVRVRRTLSASISASISRHPQPVLFPSGGVTNAGNAFNSTLMPAADVTERSKVNTDEDSFLWIDPTMTLQGGSFTRHHVPPYGYALVLGKSTDGLVRVESPAAADWVMDFADTYTVPDYTSPALLTVVSTYQGAAADYYRYYRRVVEPERYTQQITGYLARFYPKIKSAGPIEWDDDRDANLLVTHARFEVPDFWTTDAQNKFRKMEVYPWALSERLPRPETMDRKVSFALPYPMTLSQYTRLILPKRWPDHTEGKTIKDDTFEFTYDARGTGSQVDISYRWQSLADAVTPALLADWAKKMSEVRGSLGYQLQQNIRLAEAMKRKGIVWSLLASGVVGLLVGAALGWLLFRWRPRSASLPPPLDSENFDGIGGWLVLLAIAVVLRPIFLLVGAKDTFAMMGNLQNWTALTDSDSVSYNGGFAVLAWVETFAEGFLIAWSLVVIGQFFRRKASLPWSLIVMLVITLLWTIGDHYAVAQVFPSTSVKSQTKIVGAVFGQVFYMALWVPYLLVSRRVKMTFRE